MAAVSKGYGVGDTVYVWYKSVISDQFTPKSRVVSSVDVNTSGNSATVKFSDGQSVIDGATQTVFTTQALCAKDIVDYVITASAAVVALDTTTSGASTAGNASITLIRQG